MITLQVRLIDPLLLVCALLFCTYSYKEPFGDEYLAFSIITYLLSTMVFSQTRIGVDWRHAAYWDEIKETLTAWMYIVLILLIIGFITKFSGHFSRKVLLTWLFVAPFFICLARLISRRVFRAFMDLNNSQRSAVIVGSNQASSRLTEVIHNKSGTGIKIVGYFSDRVNRRDDKMGQDDLLGTLSDVADVVRSLNIPVVYIALPMIHSKRLIKVLNELRDTTACIYFLPDTSIFERPCVHINFFNDIPIFAVNEFPIFGINAVRKYLLDITISSVLLLILSPLMIISVLAIKIFSPGPVFFCQRRYGVDGKEFIIYKFRTMTVMDDGDVIQQAQVNDTRITKIGKFMRRYSIDEIPQLINVLQNRMSIVGPRPHAVAHNEMYRREIEGYMMRHMVKPGLTGLAQINGCRGETVKIKQMEQRVQYDLNYIGDWSIGLDLWIIFKTIGIVLKGDNAY